MWSHNHIASNTAHIVASCFILNTHLIAISPQQSTKQKRRVGPFKAHKGKLPTYSGVDLTSVTDVRIIDGQYNGYVGNTTVPTLDGNGMALLSSSSSILKVL